jgi:hypothetical protein
MAVVVAVVLTQDLLVQAVLVVQVSAVPVVQTIVTALMQLDTDPVVVVQVVLTTQQAHCLAVLVLQVLLFYHTLHQLQTHMMQ